MDKKAADAAIGYPLDALGEEMDRVSPEARNLIAIACSYPTTLREENRREMAVLRLKEALETRTADAKARREGGI